jgi:predicted transcriptional regulator
MEDQILKLLRRKNYAPMNVPELLRALMAQPNEQQTLQAALNKLVRKGQIARIKGNRFIIPTEASGQWLSSAGRFVDEGNPGGRQ